jgi:hypothetical protein
MTVPAQLTPVNQRRAVYSHPWKKVQIAMMESPAQPQISASRELVWAREDVLTKTHARLMPVTTRVLVHSPSTLPFPVMTEIHVQKRTSVEMREPVLVPRLFVMMTMPVPRTVATLNGAVCTWPLRMDAMMATPATAPRSVPMTGVLVRTNLSAETG